jgi:hypothetical protein
LFPVSLYITLALCVSNTLLTSQTQLSRVSKDFCFGVTSQPFSDLWSIGIGQWFFGHRRFQFLGVFAKFRKVTTSYVISVCLSAWKYSAPTGGFF